MKLSRCLLFVFAGIFLCGFVEGMAGVTPAIHEVDFKPGLNERFTFTFIFDSGVEAEIYFSGDLAEYISSDKEKVVGKESVVTFLRLPKEIEEPGVHTIRVGAKQIPSEFSGISLIADVGGLIRVKVPYPGKYASAELTASNANVGEPVEVKLKIFSKGVEDTEVTAFLIVSNENGEVGQVDMGSHFIASTQNIELFKSMETSNYLAGDYNLTAVINYGGEKPSEARTSFRLGKLYVGLSNYTKVFEKDKIEQMDVEVESFWNDGIGNVYANVSVPESELSFLTPSVNLVPWERTTLIGFFDTSKIESSKFSANITIYYEDKLTSEIVDLRIRKEIDTIVLIIGGLILAIVVLLAVIFFVLKKYSGLKKYKGLRLLRGKK